MSFSLDRSHSWFERATRVIPGGIYGHTSPALAVPGSFPAYAAKGRGARYWDVDGNEYIDFLCGFGPVLLGHQNPEVEEAADAARALGVCLNHPGTVMVELAEAMVERVDFAEWAVFGKNGSDLTTWCLRVARERTGRRMVLKARGAYHGMHAWCAPGHGGVIPEDTAQVAEFTWNSVEELEAGFRRHKGRLAALILTPFHHPAFGDSELPSPEFVATVTRLCKEWETLLILDDVRCGFRLSEAGSHGVFGFEPNLSVFSKGMGNGHPIAAAVGRTETKVAASQVFLTGSFWNSQAPMAAALKVMEIIRRDGVPAKLAAAGERLVEGMLARGRDHGVQLVASGPPAMPYVRVSGDDSLRKTQGLYSKAAARGVLFHPNHNWFLSTAHTDAEIDEALDRFTLALED